jgi:endonuclease/exonuclease/phosphatase family metal-dependent hydrolase
MPLLDHFRPTPLAMALTMTGYVLLLALCFVAMASLPALGYLGWSFAAVAAALVYLVMDLRRKLRPHLTAQTGWPRWLFWIRVWGRGFLLAVLACWLGLIVWLAFCPGGPNPPPKADAALIRVVTWNIHCGQEHGPPWKQFDWPGRKAPLQAALDQARPDLLCVQEATPEQVAFLEESLPEHGRVGIGRDGGAGGEHCAIYFNRKRFTAIGSNTFWLEEPIDQPRAGSALDVKRICTWVRLRDRVSGRTVRVYNTHLYLTEAPRLTAAKVILDHVAAGDPTDAVLLTADFNAGPSVRSRQLFLEAGLKDSAVLAGNRAGQATFQLYGIGLWCLDGILVDSHWRVARQLILAVKPQNIFPSDHFALLADLALPEESASKSANSRIDRGFPPRFRSNRADLGLTGLLQSAR